MAMFHCYVSLPKGNIIIYNNVSTNLTLPIAISATNHNQPFLKVDWLKGTPEHETARRISHQKDRGVPNVGFRRPYPSCRQQAGFP